MTRIAFTGDLGFSKYFKGLESRENLIAEEAVKFLSDSDYTVINVEGAVGSGDITSTKELTHANGYDCTTWLKKLNGKYLEHREQSHYGLRRRGLGEHV